MDNRIYSWICGDNVRVELCDHSLKDSCRDYHGASGAASKNPIMKSYKHWPEGHGGSASSIRMYAYDHVNGIGGVTVFDAKDCFYNSAYFAAAEIGQTARYTYEAVRENNFCTNRLSSIAVPYGYKATIWEKGMFTGKSEEIHGMDGKDGRALCQNVNMDNNMYSMEVEKLQFASAYGYWTLVGTGLIQYKFTWGYSQTAHESETKAVQENFSREMSKSIEHKGTGTSRTINKSVSNATQKTAE